MQPVIRTVLVTGASSGIGRAIACLLLQQGHTVIGTSRDCQKFTTPMANFFAWQLDLADLNAIHSNMRQLQQQFPHLDAVVFNAGMGQFGGLEEFSYADIDKLMTVNFTSQAFITKALLPKLKRQARGDLIYIGSEAALKGSRKGSVYCASKFALRGFTQALRQECSNSQVRLCLVNPGMVQTPFFDNLAFAPGDAASQFLWPEDVAEAVAMVLNANANAVFDEINLSPLQTVVKFKKGVQT
jgi:3-hydroxy acid dehydrogenase / malonic semialdehyde reductase